MILDGSNKSRWMDRLLASTSPMIIALGVPSFFCPGVFFRSILSTASLYDLHPRGFFWVFAAGLFRIEGFYFCKLG